MHCSKANDQNSHSEYLGIQLSSDLSCPISGTVYSFEQDIQERAVVPLCCCSIKRKE